MGMVLPKFLLMGIGTKVKDFGGQGIQPLLLWTRITPSTMTVLQKNEEKAKRGVSLPFKQTKWPIPLQSLRTANGAIVTIPSEVYTTKAILK